MLLRDDGLADDHQPVPIDDGAPVHRDELMVSLGVAYIVITLGIAATIIQSVWSGFSLFMMMMNYWWISGVKCLSYFSYMSAGVSFTHAYLNFLACLIAGIYTLYSFLAINKRYAQILFLISLLLSIVSFGMSLDLLTMCQVFDAMESRSPRWYHSPETSITGFDNWESDYFHPFIAKDAVRGIVYTIQSVIFVFAQQISAQDFQVGFDLVPRQ